MGDLNSGLLTLIAFGVLVLFAIVASVSLRGHIRKIRAPRAADLAETAEVAAEDGAAASEVPVTEVITTQDPDAETGRGPRRSPKASTRS